MSTYLLLYLNKHHYLSTNNFRYYHKTAEAQTMII